ncbi:MAG: hypothetical protein WCG37_11125 [Actinomycetes bacterium]
MADTQTAIDRLEEQFLMQMNFSRKYISRVQTQEQRLAWVKDLVLHMGVEGHEVLQASGAWKSHRVLQDSFSRSGVVEECVDVYKYLLNILLTYDVTPDEFHKAFVDKSHVVELRYEWEQRLKAMHDDINIVGVDLDGILAQYPENWIEYVNRELGTFYTLADFYEQSIPLPDIQRDQYEELKHCYREAGHESLYVKPFADAKQLLDGLKAFGLKIVILSARPYKQYKRMQNDTVKWMEHYKLPYDAFIWERDKHIKIVELVPNMACMIDDDLMVANQLSALDYNVVMRARPYNQLGDIENSRIFRCNGAEEMLKTIGELPFLGTRKRERRKNNE